MPQGGRSPRAEGQALTRAQAADRVNVSLSTIDRARRAGTLTWVPLNKRGVRIWEGDLYEWVRRGMPLALLILALGYALVTFTYGCSPAGSALHQKHHHHRNHVYGVLAEKTPRGGVRWKVKRRA